MKGNSAGISSNNDILKAAVTRLNLQKDELELKLHNLSIEPSPPPIIHL